MTLLLSALIVALGTTIVVVTHDRAGLLAKSLEVLSSQERPVDHLIVVDNSAQDEVRALVASQPVATTYLPSQFNLGGAGGFALGMLHALALGADWVWLADDDGRPEGPQVLGTLLECAERHGLAEVSPVVSTIDDPETLAFPLRRGLVWRRKRSELVDPAAPSDDVLLGIASLFNGALARPRFDEAVFRRNQTQAATVLQQQETKPKALRKKKLQAKIRKFYQAQVQLLPVFFQ